MNHARQKELAKARKLSFVVFANGIFFLGAAVILVSVTSSPQPVHQRTWSHPSIKSSKSFVEEQYNYNALETSSTSSRDIFDNVTGLQKNLTEAEMLSKGFADLSKLFN